MNSREILRASGSSFGWAFLLLPKRQRGALSALYAFCRTVDDLVDDSIDPLRTARELEGWRRLLDRFPDPPASDPPLAHELAGAVREFPIRVGDLRWILDGVETDLRKTRYRTFAELLEYCDGVASAVGFASMAIFGAERGHTEAYTLATGRALQLTNILRDVGTDGARGRIYLPLEDLSRFGVSEAEILARSYGERFVDLMRYQAERARGLYREAEAALPPSERRNYPAAEMMRRTYELLLRRIEASRFDVFPEKIRISRTRKAAVLASVWAASP